MAISESFCTKIKAFPPISTPKIYTWHKKKNNPVWSFVKTLQPTGPFRSGSWKQSLVFGPAYSGLSAFLFNFINYIFLNSSLTLTKNRCVFSLVLTRIYERAARACCARWRWPQILQPACMRSSFFRLFTRSCYKWGIALYVQTKTSLSDGMRGGTLQRRLAEKRFCFAASVDFFRGSQP